MDNDPFSSSGRSFPFANGKSPPAPTRIMDRYARTPWPHQLTNRDQCKALHSSPPPPYSSSSCQCEGFKAVPKPPKRIGPAATSHPSQVKTPQSCPCLKRGWSESFGVYQSDRFYMISGGHDGKRSVWSFGTKNTLLTLIRIQYRHLILKLIVSWERPHYCSWTIIVREQ